jgi:FkbM family methyltransferase
MTKITRAAKNAIRAALSKYGLHITSGYGVDPWDDVKRISRSWDKPIGCVFDVGANVGLTSSLLLKKFPASRVFAFEPHPETFVKLAGAASSDRFFPQQLALSDAQGQLKFYVHETASDLNSLVPNPRSVERYGEANSEITVASTTVDTFCMANEITAIDVLKIDTEGTDLRVLKGAEEMLTAGRIGFVYVEFNDCMEKPGVSGGSLISISSYLSSFGFHFIATYTDLLTTDGGIFAVANLLMARNR